MDEDAREPFDEKASEDKIRYDREMADYKPPAGAAKGKKGAKKRKKDPNAPKRPQTAFFVFSTKVSSKKMNQSKKSSKIKFYFFSIEKLLKKNSVKASELVTSQSDLEKNGRSLPM